jgi:predicted ATPase
VVRRPVSSEAIVGRDEPLRVLGELFAAAAEGRPGIALVSGEAGVGKTRLTAAAEASARARGMLVLHGECMEFGGEEFPYAPVAAALRELHVDALEDAPAELAGLLPGPAAADPGPASSGRYGQGRLCERLLTLLAAQADAHAPLAIVLEDVHWADRSSRDLIEFLARNLRSERIALVLTYRTGELEPGHPLRRLVAELGRRPVVTRLELAPLAREHVAQQLEAIAGGPVPARAVERIHALSGGNPFFVEELFAAQREDIPATLTEVVSARTARLSGTASAVLAATAAAGGRIPHDVLAAVVGDDRLGAALRECLDAGFLVRDDGDEGVALRHGLIGEVVYRDLVPYERERLHRALGRALAGKGAPAARLAPHWHRAGAREHALAASLLAGEEALRVYGFAEALGHLERALELSDRSGRPLHRRRGALGRARARGARRARPRRRAGARRPAIRAPGGVPVLG